MPANLELSLNPDSTSAFQPGDTITGSLRWQAATKTKEISIRLFWFTEGRGTEDIEIVAEHNFPVQADASGSEDFTFTLPLSPYSFSGKLISLQWAIEAITLPKEALNTLRKITVSPTAEEISLSPVASPCSEKPKKAWISNRR